MCADKIAIVTGANKGLGLAIVKALCGQFNGTVYVTSRDKERGIEACKNLENIGLHPKYHQLDITDNESIAIFCEYIQNKHGGIDLLVNNAGVLFLKDAKEPKIYQAEQTMSVNFFSLVNFCENVLPLVRNGAKIINISSSSGHLSRIPSIELRQKISDQTLDVEGLKELMSSYLEAVRNGKDLEYGWGESPYVVSKVAVNAYTFILHRRLMSKDISVNCVHPGYVQSDMTRGAGSLTPEMGAKAPLLLALSECSSGLYMWHDGTVVPWHGPDPRGYLDGKLL